MRSLYLFYHWGRHLVAVGRHIGHVGHMALAVLRHSKARVFHYAPTWAHLGSIEVHCLAPGCLFSWGCGPGSGEEEEEELLEEETYSEYVLVRDDL